MDINLVNHLSELLTLGNFKEFIYESQKLLRDKDNNLFQIVLTQQARLTELEEDMSMNKLNDDEIHEAEAHIRGTLSYVLSQLTLSRN